MNGVIRGRCPRCGGKIIYSEFYQNARDYTIRKDGKVPKRYVFMGVPITEDSASKLNEAMKKCGVSALEVAGVCERFAKIARATLDELPDGNKEEEHDD